MCVALQYVGLHCNKRYLYSVWGQRRTDSINSAIHYINELAQLTYLPLHDLCDDDISIQGSLLDKADWHILDPEVQTNRAPFQCEDRLFYILGISIIMLYHGIRYTGTLLTQMATLAQFTAWPIKYTIYSALLYVVVVILSDFLDFSCTITHILGWLHCHLLMIASEESLRGVVNT